MITRSFGCFQRNYGNIFTFNCVTSRCMIPTGLAPVIDFVTNKLSYFHFVMNHISLIILHFISDLPTNCCTSSIDFTICVYSTGRWRTLSWHRHHQLQRNSCHQDNPHHSHLDLHLVYLSCKLNPFFYDKIILLRYWTELRIFWRRMRSLQDIQMMTEMFGGCNYDGVLEETHTSDSSLARTHRLYLVSAPQQHNCSESNTSGWCSAVGVSMIPGGPKNTITFWIIVSEGLTKIILYLEA